MSVVIIEGKDLFKTYVYSEVYVKLTLKVNGRKVIEKKTGGKKKSIHPYYNEEFTFDVPTAQMSETELIVVVAVSVNLLSRSHPIGGILLGSGAPITESEHWKTVLVSPRRARGQWHSLHSME